MCHSLPPSLNLIRHKKKTSDFRVIFFTELSVLGTHCEMDSLQRKKVSIPSLLVVSGVVNKRSGDSFRCGAAQITAENYTRRPCLDIAVKRWNSSFQDLISSCAP